MLQMKAELFNAPREFFATVQKKRQRLHPKISAQCKKTAAIRRILLISTPGTPRA
jgi:hypothetical protein